MTPTARGLSKAIPLLALVGFGMPAGPTRAEAADLTRFSIEDLLQVKVVSAAKVEQALEDTAAAVSVITADDIRRSGATSVMEALRLAPGVEVARIDSSRWAITIRGFNGRFANKLLVLIDGRTVYNPQFSGVYWENLDLLLPDIERIEVVRGPGGSLWGANAVNGVINIITKNSEETQGGLVALTVGDEERTIAGVRYGGELSDSARYRLYGQLTERDGQAFPPSGEDAEDDWRIGRGGFRLDWTPSAQDSVAVQGDFFRGVFDQNYALPSLFPPYGARELARADASGGSLQVHWERRLSATSRFDLRGYYQYESREDAINIADSNIFDLDVQHSFAPTDRQQIVWGFGYRRTRDEFKDTLYTSVAPEQATTDLFSAFVQDQVDLVPERLRLTAGVKVEHNDITGWEWQPSVRMLWSPHADHRFWGSVSRAVRTPARGESAARVNLLAVPPSVFTGNLPGLFSVFSADDLRSEELVAYEIGYRTRLAPQLSIDATAFHNDYDRVISAVPGAPFPEVRSFPPYLVFPLELQNAGSGTVSGFELAVDWRPERDWRMRFAYAFSRSDIRQDATPVYYSGDRNQLSLFSSWNLRDDLDLDLWWLYVDQSGTILTLSPFGTVKVDPYSRLNLRLGWRPRKNLELSLVGANLLDDRHLEYVQEAFTLPVEIERSIYGQLKWSF